MEPGKIHHRAGYEKAKMLDHSGWTEIMPRKITPSDIDFVVELDGRVLAGELKTDITEFKDMSHGQRRTYETLARKGITVVLVKHGTPEGQDINTITDVVSFQVMASKCGQLLSSKVFPGKYWKKFLERWRDGLQGMNPEG